MICFDYSFCIAGGGTLSERFTKRDWTLFRAKITDWQEAYIDKLNREYIELLNGDGGPADKF